MEITTGRSGWVRFRRERDAVVFLRLGLRDGRRLVLREVYVDGRDDALDTADLRKLPLGEMVAAVGANPDLFQTLKSDMDLPGPDLSTLASYFASRTYGEGHWVADSFLAQMPDDQRPDDVRKVRRAREGKLEVHDTRPPIRIPEGRNLSDDFLLDVAGVYAWCIRHGAPYGKTIAEMVGVDQRTVQAWVYKARKRGLMPLTSQGRVG
ncbi:MAG: terminase gpP N-terminus-related DNA-binding protein [Actinomycetes bacterium]